MKMLWRVLGQEKFKQYRARSRVPEPSPRLAGRRLSLYDWTSFEGKELEPKSLIKRLLIRSRIDDKSIEVEGTRDGENWVPVTRWLFNMWRNAEIRTRAEDAARGKTARAVEGSAADSTAGALEDVAREIGRVRKLCKPEPKMGEAAYHVAVCRELGEGNVVEALESAGYGDVREENVTDLVKNGRRRIKREHKECSFCSPARERE
jgi:hypothetical protein